jgi:hypothetical protein
MTCRTESAGEQAELALRAAEVEARNQEQKLHEDEDSATGGRLDAPESTCVVLAAVGLPPILRVVACRRRESALT